MVNKLREVRTWGWVSVRNMNNIRNSYFQMGCVLIVVIWTLTRIPTGLDFLLSSLCLEVIGGKGPMSVSELYRILPSWGAHCSSKRYWRYVTIIAELRLHRWMRGTARINYARESRPPSLVPVVRSRIYFVILDLRFTISGKFCRFQVDAPIHRHVKRVQYIWQSKSLMSTISSLSWLL